MIRSRLPIERRCPERSTPRELPPERLSSFERHRRIQAIAKSRAQSKFEGKKLRQEIRNEQRIAKGWIV